MLPHHHRIPFYHSNWDDDIVQGDSGKDYLPWPSAVQDGSCFQRPHHVEPQKQEMRLQKNDIKSIRWGCYWVTHFQNCWKTDRNIHHVQKNRFSMPSKKQNKKTLLSPLIYLSPNQKKDQTAHQVGAPVSGVETKPAIVAKVLPNPKIAPAWRGAISRWFTLTSVDVWGRIRRWKFPSPSALLMREILQTTYYLLSPSWEAVAEFFGAPFFGRILPPPDSEVHVGLIPPHPLYIWYA